jgi:thiol:disulfide interchange protein
MRLKLTTWATCGVLGICLAGCAESTGGLSGKADPKTTGKSQASDEASKWADHTLHLPFIIGYEEGLSEAKAQKKPMMLFVTTTWCGWCKKLAEENFNDPRVKELLSQFVLVIVDGDTEKEVTAKLGVDGYPHLVFQSSSGQKLGEQQGYAPVAEFTKVVEAALAKAGNT